MLVKLSKFFLYGIVLILIVGLFQSCGKTDDDVKTNKNEVSIVETQNKNVETVSAETKTVETKTEINNFPTNFREGIYEVGKDIEPGEYIIIGDDSNNLCYYAIMDTSKHLITDEMFKNRSIISVNKGELFDLRSGATAYTDITAPKTEELGFILKNGTYKIGKDIPQGVYTVPFTNGWSIEIHKNSRHIYDDAIYKKSFNGTKQIELKDGTYVTVQQTN